MIPSDRPNKAKNAHHSDPNGNSARSTTPQLSQIDLDVNKLQTPNQDGDKSEQSAQVITRRQFWQLHQGWDNLSFRYKLTLLLLAGAAIPVAILTQFGVTALHRESIKGLEKTLQTNLLIQKNSYDNLQENAQQEAASLANQVEKAAIDLNDSKAISLHSSSLNQLVNHFGEESNFSFVFLTDTQGKTVAQQIKILNQDFSQASPLPNEEASTDPNYRQVNVSLGLNLGDIPIVKNALTNQRPLNGAELIEGSILARLGLAPQASIKVRPQPIQGLPEAKQPAPEGTYEIDQGNVGLVSMAVYPVKVNNQVVGTAIVGTLLNRDYTIVDDLKTKYGVPVATFFARDFRVSSNVPYFDPQTKLPDRTRAVGIRAAREVSNPVLNQGQKYIGSSNIGGEDYLGGYAPLYDHQKALNPTQAKPIGMYGLAVPQTEVQKQLNGYKWVGYSVGGGLLALLGLLALPVADTFSRPVRRLSRFARQIGSGEQGVRLETTQRQDELGVLAKELNQMAASIDANLEARRQETEQASFFANIARSSTGNAEELESVFNQVLQGAREILNADRVVIYRFNLDWSGYINAESVATGWSVALNNKIEDACISQYLIEAYRKGRVVPTNDVRTAGFHPEHMKLLERLQIKANLVTPIVQNDQLFGLLIAHHCTAPHVWQQSEVNFLKETSNRLGVILDRIAFLEQKEAEAERSQLLKDITVSIGQSLDPAEIFNKAVQEVRQALKSDRVVVYSFNNKWQGTVIAESVADGWTKALAAKIDDPCFADRYVERYRQGRVQATENIYQAGLTDCHLKQLATFEVKANLVAPILQGGNLLGLLIAHQCSAPRTWEQGEIDLFAQLATQIGFALDRANLLNQQKNAKEFLQRRALELLMEVDPISRGDLTIRAKVTEDEIGTIADSYNATIDSLRKIVTQVQTAAQQVASTTSSSEGSVQGLSKEALRQSEEIGVALERIQEMTNSIRAVATSAEQAEAAVKQANQTVAAGDAAMNRTVDGMMAIRQTVAETSKKVKRLGESSQKISKVVNLISTFADQTNLLALNASIEAAHAGEQGRGFAVVADEVRTLARQSAEATAEIESLVKDIQSETNEVVAAMEAGTEQVVTGTELVNETRHNLVKITEVSQQISDLVAAIAQSAVAQSQASQIVSVKMSDVATIANQTSSEATVVSSAFKELLTLAQELQASASQFKVR